MGGFLIKDLFEKPFFCFMKRMIAGLACLFYLATASGQDYLLAGTYTNAGSFGIYVFKFEQGALKLIDSASAVNPSYMALSPDQKFLYAVSETSEPQRPGAITSFAFDKNSGALALKSTAPSGGNDPCYITIDKTGRWVMAANYSSGTLSLLRSTAGMLDTVQVIKHFGAGPDPGRQSRPHVHSTVLSPDEKYVYAADLGIDKLMTYRFNAQDGKLTQASVPFVKVNPGNGPRHLVFHPNKKFAYLIEELSGTITVFRYHHADGRLTQLQNISTMEPGSKGFAGSADIHISPDGKFLYGSNRGVANNIVVYRISKKNGQLKTVGFQDVMGTAPRNFILSKDGQYLLVANQNTNSIVVFLRNKKTGMLSKLNKDVSLSRPVCLLWADH